MTGAEKRIVAITMASHALAHFYEQTFPPVLRLVDAEFGLGLTAAGGMGNIFPLFFGLGALPAGMVVDRWGARRTLLAYLITCAVAAVATLFFHNIWVIGFLFALMGGAAGLYHPAGATLISHNVEQVGTGLGLHGVGGNLGLAVSPLLAALVAAMMGWRAAYAVLALPSIIMAVYFLKNDEIGNGVTIPEKDISDDVKKTATDNDDRTRWVPLIMLFALGVLNGFCYRGMLTFFPTFFAGNSPGEKEILEGGVFTTGVLIIGVLGQYIGGKLADRFRQEVVYAACFTISVPFLASISLFKPGAAVGVAILFAFFYFASQPVGNSIVTRLSSTSFRGRAFGIFFFMNFGMGSFAATISGWVGEHYGIEAIFPFLGAVLLGVSLIGWSLVIMMARTAKTGG